LATHEHPTKGNCCRNFTCPIKPVVVRCLRMNHRSSRQKLYLPTQPTSLSSIAPVFCFLRPAVPEFAQIPQTICTHTFHTPNRRDRNLPKYMPLLRSLLQRYCLRPAVLTIFTRTWVLSGQATSVLYFQPGHSLLREILLLPSPSRWFIVSEVQDPTDRMCMTSQLSSNS
jgi:hypothetical protein